MSKKKKAIIITVIILGIILLPVIGFFGMKTIMDWGVPKDVDLPNLVGKTLEEANKEIEKTADHVFYIPSTEDILLPSLAVVPLQLFAYYVASMKGCDIDKPRNLAKSVTVE